MDRWLRLDLNPFPGFSGDPIVNAGGEAIGMATSGARRSAVTIPASTVNRVVDQSRAARPDRAGLSWRRHAAGSVLRGDSPIAGPQLRTRGAGGSGSSRQPGGERRHSAGSIIVAAEGSPIESVQSLQPFLDSEYVGKAISLDVVRGGQLVKLSVTVGEKLRS